MSVTSALPSLPDYITSPSIQPALNTVTIKTVKDAPKVGPMKKSRTNEEGSVSNIRKPKKKAIPVSGHSALPESAVASSKMPSSINVGKVIGSNPDLKHSKIKFTKSLLQKPAVSQSQAQASPKRNTPKANKTPTSPLRKAGKRTTSRSLSLSSPLKAVKKLPAEDKDVGLKRKRHFNCKRLYTF